MEIIGSSNTSEILPCSAVLGDCLEQMNFIPSGSVDAVLCDLPYGTTRCSWDSVIPFDDLWKHYHRIVKKNGAIVLTHPTQKPVELFEYLLRTYTLEGDVVLDNCAGSFTTAVACDNLKRKWICIEQDEKYFNIGTRRVKENETRLSMELF